MRYLLLLILFIPATSNGQGINMALSMAMDESISSNEYEEIGSIIERGIKSVDESNIVYTRDESDIIVSVVLMEYGEVYAVSLTAILKDNTLDGYLASTLAMFEDPEGLEHIVGKWLLEKVVNPIKKKHQ